MGRKKQWHPVFAELLRPMVELGLGIHRCLNEERAKQRAPTLEPEETALWYLGGVGRSLAPRRILNSAGWKLEVSLARQTREPLRLDLTPILVQLKATDHPRLISQGRLVACRIERADLRAWLHEPCWPR